MANKKVELVLAAKNKTGKAFDAVNKNISTLERQARRVQSLGSVFTGLIAGFGVISTFRAIIEKTKEQEAAIAQVEARLKSTGGASQKTSEELQEMASSLQKVTTFGDEAILSMQSMLLTFTNIKGDNFDEATKSILDMSVALKIDLKSASIQVGKALNDPIKGVTALTKSGVQFTETQKDLIKSLVETGQTAKAQGVILDELKVQFGGAAESAADTFGGALEQLSTAFGDLLEAKGSGLTRAKEEIQGLAAVLQDPKTVEAMNNLTDAAISMAGSMAGGLAKAAVAFNDVGIAIGESLAKAVLTVQGASDELIYLDETLYNVNEQAAETTGSVESLADTVDRLGREADESRDLLEELGGVQVGGDQFSESVDKVLEKLEEERKLLKLSAKERFIYNRVKKAGADATYEEINAIKKSAEALFEEKEAARQAKDEILKLSDVKKQAKNIAGEITTGIQEELNNNPVSVRLGNPSKKEIEGNANQARSTVNNIGGLNSGLSGVSISRQSIKEGSKI